MTHEHLAPAVDTPAQEAPIPDLIPASPPRGLSRRAVAAILAVSALVHAGFLGYAAYESQAWDARHPVVEVIDFRAETTVGPDGKEETVWEGQGGAHRARVTLAER